MKIALLGADSTGQSQLARQLAEHFRLQGRQVAIDSGMLLEDGELLRCALEGQWRYDVTLLMGLELPWTTDRLQSEGPIEREQVDRQLRELLAAAHISFHVVYGQGESRVANALAALETEMAARKPMVAVQAPLRITRDANPAGADVPSRPKRWQWTCDKCSDPGCEHRLFTLRSGADSVPGTAVATSKIDR